jgi:hypothetical protein
MRLAAVVLAVVGVLALLWIGGEAHYQSCVSAAVARTPAPTKESTGNPFEDFATGSGTERFKAVDGCSRLP